MRIISLLLTVLCFIQYTSSQSSKRAFKQLEKQDYIKAEELFFKILEEDKVNPAACFGMSLIYADDRYTGFNLVTSWKYASIVEKNIESLNQEDIESIGEYFLNTETRKTSRPVKKKIQIAIAAIEDKLIKYIREENNLEIAYDVLDNFPDFRYYDNVVHIKNQLEFRKYEKQNTLDAYQEFINKFPDAAQIGKAIKYRNALAFQEVRRAGTVKAYNEYMSLYPDALEFQTALKERNAAAFREAKQQNSIEAMEEFINNYPATLEIAEAKIIQKKLLYENAKKIKTLDAYNDFIRRYPDGQQYIDIFNLKSLDLGMQYISNTGIAGNHAIWARIFDNNQFNESAIDIAVNSRNEYILAGKTENPDSSDRKIWILKLDKDGKMIWNKFYNEFYKNEIKMIKVNQKDEIILAGYTYRSLDSLSRDAWIFKLGNEGQMLWNRSLGKFNLTCMLVSGSMDEIIIGGSVPHDTLPSQFGLIKLNDEGKRLWTREYAAEGTISSITQKSNGNILFGGNLWLGEITSAGYLVWNDFPGETFHVNAVFENADINYFLGRNDNTAKLISYNSNGIKRLNKELPLVRLSDNTIYNLLNGKIVAIDSDDIKLNFNLINITTTAVENSSYSCSSLPRAILNDKEGNYLLLLTDLDLVLVKISKTFF